MSQPPSPPPDPYPYGRPSYVPPPYGPPGAPWAPGGPGGGQPPQKTHTTAITLSVVGGVAVLVVVATAFFLVGRNKGNDLAGSLSSLASLASSAAALPTASTTTDQARPYQPRSTNTSIPPAAAPPDNLGSDPVFDALAQKCYDGDMQACDDLFANSDSNSLYEAYGDTCAGRQEPGTDTYCTTSFPGS